MPTPAGNKRVKGISIFRPFVYGNVTTPIDPNKRPEGIDKDHSHAWKLYVKGVDDEDISYWLKKVQFQLHHSYNNALRTIEQPPFEVKETGWGEFELSIKLYFIPESGEKPQTIWHTLKIHPYGPDADRQRAERLPIVSQNYEEVIFNEPVEQFYEILTGGAEKSHKGKSGKAGSKQASIARNNHERRTAEIPERATADNVYSKETEGKELDRMKEAMRKVEEMTVKERKLLVERESLLENLREKEGPVPKKR
ncbi:MAG: NuA4 histone H4 acetyltransferase complex and the SWR1 complex subunit [Caeruleum heppii]|nr:MAG: NuA4 histone H4 acetyltransferase complex and the SWR1 complex subunit [Caeruleum heppii]